MGSFLCSRVQQVPSTEMGVLSVEMSDNLRLSQNNRQEVNMHTSQECDANLGSDVNKLHGNQPQIKLQTKTEYCEAQLGMKQPASFIRQDPPDNRVLYPKADRARKEGGNNKMSIDQCISQTKKQLMNIPAANVDRNITTVLERLMESEDEEIKALAKKLLAKAALPEARPGGRKRRKHRRARSLTSLKHLRVPNSGYPGYGHVDTARKKTQLQPEGNSNDDHLLDSSQSRLHFDDEEQSNTNLEHLSTGPNSSQDQSFEKSMTENYPEHEIQEVMEYSKLRLEKTRRKSANLSEKLKNMRSLSDTLNTISLTKQGLLRRSSETPNLSIFSIIESSVEGDEELALQTSENDFLDLHDEELGMISRDIDEFEQKLNETRAEIRMLRRESVTMLTNEGSDSEKNSDTDKVPEKLSFLEIEQKISQLEDESHKLEIQRREALSTLQNKMLGNILGSTQKELLPILPTPMPEKLTASMRFKLQTPIPSYEVRASNCCQFSRLTLSSEGEATDVEEPSTQREEIYNTKEEKPNEK